MKVKDLINLNFGISGPIGIKDVDDLADEKVTILMDGVKDKEIKKYYDWEVVAEFPLFIEFDENKAIKKFLLFFKRKKYKEEETVLRRPIIALAVCNHVISELSQSEDDSEEELDIPKNYN